MISGADDESDDEPVGYGRPPKVTRFRQGQSGNPAGRPRKTDKPSVGADLNSALDLKVEQTTKDGRKVKKALREIIVDGVIAKAMKGDAKAAVTLLKLYDNKIQELEPVVFEITRAESEV